MFSYPGIEYKYLYIMIILTFVSLNKFVMKIFGAINLMMFI
jgi:hypothetical protein